MYWCQNDSLLDIHSAVSHPVPGLHVVFERGSLGLASRCQQDNLGVFFLYSLIKALLVRLVSSDSSFPSCSSSVKAALVSGGMDTHSSLLVSCGQCVAYGRSSLASNGTGFGRDLPRRVRVWDHLPRLHWADVVLELAHCPSYDICDSIPVVVGSGVDVGVVSFRVRFICLYS